MLRHLIACAVLLGAVAGPGCEKEKAGGDCAAAAADLRTWLTAVMSDQAVQAPWPTGDAAFDAELPAMRERVREQWQPPGSEKATQLAEGIKPGRLEEELASCQPALDQLVKVGQAAPAERTATFARLADAIARCDCKVNIPRVKALIYLGWRGPH